MFATVLKRIGLHIILGLSALGMVMAFVPGCANIQSPMGGPRDSFPPVLLKANPPENTTNFKGKIVSLQFDEFVELDNIFQNMVINPPADNYPTIEGKLRNVTIKIKDTLQPNTTYTFNFGDAITDVNEKNKFKNFSYTFSTGSYIDSLSLSGTIIDAETGLPDSTLSILLHTSADDSAVAKLKPRFVTRPNGKGVFRFNHLPGGSFYLFAIKDEGAKKYTSPETPFAFFGKVLSTNAPDSVYNLRSFVAEKRGANKVTVTTGLRPNANKAAPEKLKYSTNVLGNGQDLLQPFTLIFNKPINSYDSTKLVLTDTLFNPLAAPKFSLDSTKTQLTLQTVWKPDEQYKLLILKGFATDTSGAAYSKIDTVSFKTLAESEYGLVKIKFSGVDFAKHPVLQWVENDKIVSSAPLTTTQFRTPLFKPGQYKLRLLYDSNQNGIYDTGDYWKKRQPEQVQAIDQPFNIKANWDNEFDVILR